MTSGIPFGPIRTRYLPARRVPAFWRQWRYSVRDSQRRMDAWITFSKGPFFLTGLIRPCMRSPWQSGGPKAPDGAGSPPGYTWHPG